MGLLKRFHPLKFANGLFAILSFAPFLSAWRNFVASILLLVLTRRVQNGIF